MSEPDTRQFDFGQVVEDQFSPLLEQGFQLVRRGPDALRYESPTVFVKIFTLDLEHAVDLDVGLLTAPRNQVSLAGLLALAGEPATGPVGLSTEAVSAMATALFRYGGRALSGDAAEYARATELNRRYAAEFRHEAEPASIGLREHL
jgi:hypothetical protein